MRSSWPDVVGRGAAVADLGAETRRQMNLRSPPQETRSSLAPLIDSPKRSKKTNQTKRKKKYGALPLPKLSALFFSPPVYHPPLILPIQPSSLFFLPALLHDAGSQFHPLRVVSVVMALGAATVRQAGDELGVDEGAQLV